MVIIANMKMFSLPLMMVFVLSAASSASAQVLYPRGHTFEDLADPFRSLQREEQRVERDRLELNRYWNELESRRRLENIDRNTRGGALDNTRDNRPSYQRYLPIDPFSR